MEQVNTRITAQANQCNGDGHSIQGGIVTTSKAVSYGVDCKDDWRKRFNKNQTNFTGTGNTTGDTISVC